MSRPPRAREPIKLAALELFVTQGVHATGIREIARKAGCSEAALYRHWSNKEHLVGSLFGEHMGEVVNLLEQAIGAGDDLEAKVAGACEAAFRLYDEQPLVFRFVLLVRHEQAGYLPEGTRMPQDAIEELLGPAVGGDERAARVAAAAALGIFLQTAEYVVYGRLAGPLLDYRDEVVANVMRLVR